DVTGTQTRVYAESVQGQPMLSVYRDGQLQTRLTQTPDSVKRLLVRGLTGNHNIFLGPPGGFTFPELIADAGPGNTLIDASAVAQGVTLLGGAGSDTLVGGSGPNYLRGGTGGTYFKNFKSTDTVIGGSTSTGDSYETFDANFSRSNWTS